MKRFVHAAMALAMTSSLVAWDTHTLGPEPGHWQSIYTFPPEAASPGDRYYLGIDKNPNLIAGNEHAELSHIVLQQLGWTQLYDELPSVIDLNESIYRRNKLRVDILPSIVDAYGDETETGLTERKIPHPARFSGTPDFSYTIADWLNKNQYCPAIPQGAPFYDKCHVFKYWLGGVFNASHFGEQATHMYFYFHGVSLALAENAKIMGDSMNAAVAAGDGDRTELEKFVREAELEAMIYEAYAQHFLQDRWASGHMWNRWNAPAYEYLDLPVTTEAEVTVHRVIGAFSGMIHGAEVALKGAAIGNVGLPRELLADPMSSPTISGPAAIGVSHVEGNCQPTANNGNGCLEPGVGDYRLKDMMRKKFGAQYYGSDFALDVDEQRAGMLACSNAGWIDIAKHLSANSSGGFGVLGLTIPPGSPAFVDDGRSEVTVGGTRVKCWEQWATNTAMSQGRLLAVVLSSNHIGRLVLFAGTRFRRLLSLINPADLVRLRQQMMLAKKKKPNGTELARKWQSTTPSANTPNNLGLITFQGAKPGHEYDNFPIAHHEPNSPMLPGLPFVNLPDQSDAYGKRWDDKMEVDDPDARPGLDKHTLYGFFNKAHTNYWCEEADEKLPWRDDIEVFVDDEHTRTHPSQGMRMPVPRPEDPAELGESQRRMDACILLADRLYRGTKAVYLPEAQQTYTGSSQEIRRLEHGDASRPAVLPPCDVFRGGSHVWADGPQDLHPGYVVAAEQGDPQTGPYVTAEKYGHTYYQSIANWCAALPVVSVDSNDIAVDLLSGQAIDVTPGYTSDDEVSFATSFLNPQVTIYGHNFGEAQGRVRLTSESGCIDEVNVSPLADIVSWSEESITFTVTNTRFIPDLYAITVIRDDRDENGSRIRSVGRALLDVRKSVFTDTASPGDPLPTDASNRPFRAIHPYCTGGTVLQHEIWDCTDVAGRELVDCGDDMVGAGTQLWQHVAGPYTAQAGPYDEHTWTVDQIGACADMVFPSQPCPTTLPAYYGLTYRFDRTSTDPITATNRTWRFVLGWQRPS